jgi:hypothetical protein
MVDVGARARGGADDLRQALGELLADDRVGLLLQRLGALGDRLRLGEPLRAHRRALGLAARLGGRRLRLADLARLLGLGGGGELDALGVGGRGELDAARVGLRLELGLALGRLGERDPRLALALGLDPLAVGLGVGGLAHGRLEPLLLALGLEVGDLGLLDDHLLARLGVGQRARLGGRRGGAVLLGLEGGELDRRIALGPPRRAARRAP